MELLGPSKTLLVSILTFGRLENVISLLTGIVPMLETFSLHSGIPVTTVVRNNDPTVDASELVTKIEALGAASVDVALISGEPNTGFGRGHNDNLRLYPSEFILILNDDLGLPHLDWLPAALTMFESDPRLVLVGDDSNPQYLNPTFGNGVALGGRQYPLKYAEASVLVGRASLLQRIGMFDESFEWAMCEDADLSLVVQSLGYQIAWLPMPHEHWRGSSFKTLPPPVKASVEERNRARLFAKWGNSIRTGAVGRFTLIDLWSDGIGDVFCALPHLLAELDRLPPDRQAQFVINSNQAELLEALLPATVEIISHPKTEEIVRSHQFGFATIRTIRQINYSLPVNLHALLAGALSLPIADASAMAIFRDRLRAVGRSKSRMKIDGRYCVFHAEFQRQGHDGRRMSPLLRNQVLRAAAERYDQVVVVGRETTVAVGDQYDLPDNVIDLQGKLSTFDLIAVIGDATAHVGIDSFPAHIAQAFGIPSVVFFGSVHPQSRLWPDAAVWPLVAKLPCIGCYHLHIEPSAPFCLRRDRACERDVPRASIEQAFDRIAVRADETAERLTTRWQELQARQIELQVFHPSAQIATARPAHLPIEPIANLICEVTDRIAELYQNQRGSAVVDRLEHRVRELEMRLADREFELAKTEALLQHRSSTSVAADLSEIITDAHGCEITKTDGELDVICLSNDPQILFAPIEVASGPVFVQIESVSSAPDTLEIFWSEQSDGFSQSRAVQVRIGTQRQTRRVKVVSNWAEKLWLRIDPSNSPGRIKLRLKVFGRLYSNTESTEPAMKGAQSPAIEEAEPAVRGTEPPNVDETELTVDTTHIVALQEVNPIGQKRVRR